MREKLRKNWGEKGKTEPMGLAILPPHNTTPHHCFRFAWLHHPISTPRLHPSGSFHLHFSAAQSSFSCQKQLLSVFAVRKGLDKEVFKCVGVAGTACYQWHLCPSSKS